MPEAATRREEFAAKYAAEFGAFPTAPHEVRFWFEFVDHVRDELMADLFAAVGEKYDGKIKPRLQVFRKVYHVLKAKHDRERHGLASAKCLICSGSGWINFAAPVRLNTETNKFELQIGAQGTGRAPYRHAVPCTCEDGRKLGKPFDHRIQREALEFVQRIRQLARERHIKSFEEAQDVFYEEVPNDPTSHTQ